MGLAADNTMLDDCMISIVWPGRYDTCTCTPGGTSFSCNETRSAGTQAGYQILYLFITLLVSIASGLLTGKIVSFLPCPKEFFVDSELWEVPSYEHPFYFDTLSKHRLQLGEMETACFDPMDEVSSEDDAEPEESRESNLNDPAFINAKLDWILDSLGNPGAPAPAPAPAAPPPAPAENISANQI